MNPGSVDTGGLLKYDYTQPEAKKRGPKPRAGRRRGRAQQRRAEDAAHEPAERRLFAFALGAMG